MVIISVLPNTYERLNKKAQKKNEPMDAIISRLLDTEEALSTMEALITQSHDAMTQARDKGVIYKMREEGDEGELRYDNTWRYCGYYR